MSVNSHRKPIQLIGYGPDGIKIFPSLRGAARQVGLPASSVHRYIKQGREVNGWSFNYYMIDYEELIKPETFVVELPHSELWRLIICPNEDAKISDVFIAVSSDTEPYKGVEIEGLGEKLKVSIKPETLIHMRCGAWSAVMQSFNGDKWNNDSIHTSAVYVPRPDNKQYITTLTHFIEQIQ